MFKIIIPCFGDKSSNLSNLTNSLDKQDVDADVECFFLEDEISDNFKKDLQELCSSSKNKFLVENFYQKRLYGLFNVCRFLDDLDEDCIIGIIDSDDYLWGNDCLSNVKKQYDLGFDCVWTGNELTGIGVNFSGPLSDDADVYTHDWVSSHFKTFKLSDYKTVCPANFLDEKGDWFKACYDQALMLPILHNILNRGGKTKYIDKVHYIYNGPTSINEDSEYRKSQLYNEHFIRSRGYVCE